GSGLNAKPESQDDGALTAGAKSDPGVVVQQTLITPVPTKMAIEKLRGFVADHKASILKIDGYDIRLEIAEDSDSRQRRLTDRPITFQLDLRFEEQRVHRERDDGKLNTGGVLWTRIFAS